MSKTKVFSIFLGGVGGISPHLVNRASILMRPESANEISTIVTIGYIVGLAIIAFLGAVIVTAFKESDSRKAFFLGISAPALITIAASESAGNKVGHHTEINALSGARYGVISYAFSSERDMRERVEVPGRFIEVFAVKDSELFSVMFYDLEKSPIQEVALNDKGFGLVSVPLSAELLTFKKDRQESDPIVLSTDSGDMTAFLVSVTGEREYGFLSAFGQAPRITYSFDVVSEEISRASVGDKGWSYAGKFSGEKWLGRFFSFGENDLPAEGDEVSILYPVNLRNGPSVSDNSIGQLRLNQKVTVLDSFSSDSENYWIEAEVLE
ncbi:hypothetical protein HVA01_32970 [Halovibrio variabilis]|uniref:Uncharacterized protein n=1 Tax=Halovibrio variabilis TaxID=31910 RepID=A0A511UUN6_9GAMM|nr:SH3 domain-containing protein [Halovibrio variabilis]GEN29651.1 hypothetical protein HVA01_32970 [Halovibrio variabilis]